MARRKGLPAESEIEYADVILDDRTADVVLHD
jgi:hypothetical protein